MVVVPGPTPVSTPVKVLIVAADKLLLVHVPPPASDKVNEPPTHVELPPVIAPGSGLTITDVVILHPVLPKVYVIVGVPAETPVTMPVPMPIVAWEVLLLVQRPPVTASVRVVVDPAHTLVVPPITAGNGLTVTGEEVIQPVGAV